ncbi:baculoviral IAP repeat-containing protein 7-A-like [Dreissena polymorpha]|uniref:baculoviral IAP repeat-containing protein 7-A-like n=1 Tax=Dreissena polymorpha TaxID=45954 RepID=UPI0022648046|nr:baculoviral IAP repeat-containing protein 7-A-like [Dreissena polymorpha]XP_052244263.1 baculoviral IAP repeat-containing protein 7-A-like [Dreissena polymorpha]XP_052244264.1 baculoviral IAP repeat-containing protein 7-A-like [Dreissena polymorpha]
MDMSLRQVNDDEPTLPQPSLTDNDRNVPHIEERRLGIHTTRPLHTGQAILQRRVKSFDRSPEIIRHRALELATAGFYYFGYADCVRCFFCGIVLRRWEPGDVAWAEHVRWNPSCTFVQLNS